MGKEEWRYWTTAETLAKESDWMAAFARRKLGPLTAVYIQSAGEHLLFLADVALHTDWVSQMNAHPVKTVQTHHKLFQWAAGHKALVLAYHFPPFPSLGGIVPNEEGWQWQAIDYVNHLNKGYETWLNSQATGLLWMI